MNEESEVKKYTFSTFQTEVSDSEKVKKYDFGDLSLGNFNKEKISQEIIRQERKNERSSSFKIDESVRKLRGLEDQEKSDFDNKVELKVQSKVQELSESIKEKSYTEGYEKGRLEAFSKYESELIKALTDLNQEISQIKEQAKLYVEDKKNLLVNTTQGLVKWVLLKEMEDSQYLQRLVEKLIHEINHKQNLLIKVNPESLGIIQDYIPKLEEKLGSLPNLRIESFPDIARQGIMLVSDNAIIDATQEKVMSLIDKIFSEANQNEPN